MTHEAKLPVGKETKNRRCLQPLKFVLRGIPTMSDTPVGGKSLMVINAQKEIQENVFKQPAVPKRKKILDENTYTEVSLNRYHFHGFSTI